jgi:hypothetical protein
MRTLFGILVAATVLIGVALVRGVTYALTHAMGGFPPPH